MQSPGSNRALIPESAKAPVLSRGVKAAKFRARPACGAPTQAERTLCTMMPSAGALASGPSAVTNAARRARAADT